MFNGINGLLFQQSLQDLVKGIRSHRRDEEEYIRSKLTEIADECRSSEATKKTNAVLKLTYLQMMGYSASFASFHIVEVMSSSDFASKRIGYLAAAQCFSPATDVLLLTTNQFKKDLTNGKLQDCSQALTCLAKIITEELGRDLEKDVSLLLASPRPYIRKKALLVLYRLILVHPDTLPIVSARFRERLTDSDPGVLCAAVTVTTELSRASPSTFLSLAPLLYQLLMSKDSNNWMLIKIVKLMGVLTPLEPRLGKKLVEPLTNLMRTTRAKSLLYECCSTVTAGLLDHPEAVELCAKRLAEFMDDSDQNLKYLGLLSMRRLIQAHPHLAVDHRDNILDCLDDEDIGIRMRALELVSEFITKRNLRDISRILLRKLRKAAAEGFIVDDPTLATAVSDNPSDSMRSAFSASVDQEAPFREALARQLLRAGEYKRATTTFKGGYEMLSTADDFTWYITSILGGLSEIALLSTAVRTLLSEQFLELTSRVEALRQVSVKIAYTLLSLRSGKRVDNVANGALDADGAPASTVQQEDNGKSARGAEIGNSNAILSPTLAGNIAWILGEYADLIEDFVAVSKRLVHFPKRGLDSASQVRILTACVKVFVTCRDEEAQQVFDIIHGYIDSLVNSQFAEVQDRAWFFSTLLTEFGAQRRKQLAPLFAGKLIPVDPRAQSKVPVSTDLDLDTPLLHLGSDSLFVYLKHRVGGDGAETDDDGDDEKDIFKEAVFASNVLSMNIGSMTSVDASSSLSILPDNRGVTDVRGASPFYLDGAKSSFSDARSLSSVGAGAEDEQYDRMKLGLDAGRSTSEEAVVIAEENPLGLSISDDERGERTQSKLESRLQEAFDSGAVAKNPNKGVPDKGKKEKKKKKKKKNTEQAQSKTANTSKPSFSAHDLIDFGDDVGNEDATPAQSRQTPNYFADTELL